MEVVTATATVAIATRNRKDELRAAIDSARSQTVPVEVVVVDDASTDGTSEMLRNGYPEVRLISHHQSLGYIARRNEAARLATGQIIFSIDDDAVFSTNRVVEQTLLEFSSDRIGAVAIPYVNINGDRSVRQKAPDYDSIYVTDAYVGTAYAVRRDLFFSLGGYREHLVHQGEESDFCIRMLAAGHVVRLGNADPIHHFESPRRDLRRMDFYGARNAVLFAWENVPLVFLWAHLPVTTVRCLLWTLRTDRFMTRLSGVIDGYREGMKKRRAPVSSAVYRLARGLRKRGPRRLGHIPLPDQRLLSRPAALPTTRRSMIPD